MVKVNHLKDAIYLLQANDISIVAVSEKAFVYWPLAAQQAGPAPPRSTPARACPASGHKASPPSGVSPRRSKQWPRTEVRAPTGDRRDRSRL